jgi:hypothetical protein
LTLEVLQDSVDITLVERRLNWNLDAAHFR